MPEQITPLEMIAILPDEKRATAKRFCELGEKLNCKPEIRYAKVNKYWRCVFKAQRINKVLFTIECTEQWWRIKAILANMAQFTERLSECSEELRQKILTAYDCHHCNDFCKRAIPYTYEGNEYSKCIGCSYYLADLSDADWTDVMSLIKEDAKAYGVKV
jgi:hypothetical protein